MKKSSPWTTHASKVIFQTPWVKLTENEVTTPGGKPGSYTVLEAKPFVIIVAFDDNEQMVMIEQYRYPLKRSVLEFPAGGIEKGETLLAAAQRELREETGYEADFWYYDGMFYELVSICRQPGHLLIARGLRRVETTLQSQEGITAAHLVSREELKQKIQDGEIIDTITPSVFYKAQLYPYGA